jgi:hypothetical protein
MQKKDTAKPKPTKANLRAKLARDLAAVLANPATPVTLYNAIADCLCDFETRRDFHTAAHIETTIATYYASEIERKGGQR